MSRDIDTYYEDQALKFVKEIDSDAAGSMDKYAPRIEAESADFHLPENQLSVNFDPQPTTLHIKNFTFKPGPLYLTTCYEEVSRNLVYVSVGKRMKNKVDLVSVQYDKTSEEATGPQRLLQCYNAGYDYWYSSFKKGPCTIGHHLSGKAPDDTNLVVRINRLLIKQKPFEPVFGSICLYTFLNDEIHRLCEAFYFDGTPDNIKGGYRFFYCENQESEFTTEPIRPTSIHVADATGAATTNFNMFAAVLPEELRLKDVFMVIQLNKFLTTDAEKAISPYLVKSTPADAKKNREASERLGKFRQPIGFAISKVFDENGKVLCPSTGEMSIPFYAQKACFSDFAVGQVIKEMFPSDNTSPYYRFDLLDIELKLSLYDVGGPDQIIEKMQEFKLFTPPPSRAQSATPLEPHFVEAQVLSQTSQLVFKPESTRLEPLGGKCGVRKVMPLISSAFPWAKAVSRQLKTTVENTIYVYPIQFDRFPSNYRNICSKIELIELRGNLPDRKLPNAFTAHDVLCSIYNHSSITGSSFVKEAYTRVSYHAKNPVTNDEFKIRLPDVLTSRHWIKFTAYHVHVKLQASRGSILQSIIRTSNDKEDGESSIIGIGYLPLMLSGDCLIGDEEHLVLLLNQEADVNKMTLEIRETNGSFAAIPTGAAAGVEIPSIRVRTRSLCSLVSMDRKVQSLFKNNPIPLGYLPSSIMPLDVAGKICYRACSLEPKEVKLTASLVDVTKASNIELCRHFLAIFRMLVRSLLGGTCAYNQSYICPYQHLPARSQAFLTMIMLFDKIFGDIGNSSAALNDSSREREVLDVCVDYLLDEEVPIPEDFVHKIATHYMIRANSNADLSQPSSAPSSSYSTNIQPFSSSHLDQLLQSKASNVSASAKESKEDVPNEIVAEEEDSTSVRASPAVEQSMSTPVSIQPIDISRPISIRSVALSDNTTEGISANRVSVSSDDADDSSGKADAEEESFGTSPSQTITPEKSVQDEDFRHSSTTANTDNLEQPSPSSVESTPEVSRKALPSADGAPSVQFDLPKLSSSLIDDDEDDVEDGDDAADEPRITSADRRSWGGYITDSMWLSGRFSAVSSLRTGAVDLENDLASKYLDDIAQHIVLQVSRLVEERLLNVAVHTIAKVVEYNSANNVETESSLTEEFILAGKRYRYSGAFDTLMPPLPFETEKAWFKSIDDGQLIDKEDISVNSALNLQHLNKRLSSVRVLERESLHLGAVEPMYDTLEGYDSRLEMSIAPDPHFAIMKHWWPYLYEVLTYQWAAVLMQVSSTGYSDETITNEYPLQFTTDQAKDFRNLVMEHGPIMLRMIHKSLALRINREGKRPPVMLDNQYFNMLELMVQMLAAEACTVASTVWRSRRVVQSLAKFINSLFALVAPKQVLRLVRAYFKALRGSKSPVEETEQRLLFLQEMSYFDHAVAVNFPYTLDAPLSLFLGSIEDVDNPTDEMLAVSYSFTGIRFALCPTPYTLAYTLISEVMTSYRLDSNKRQPALAILRDVLVRHAFDARYQKPGRQQRIACMYIPVLGEFMRELDRLWTLKFDSVERREMLAIVLYILGGIPDRILRAILRQCCFTATSRSNSSKKDFRFSTMMDSSTSTVSAALRVLSLKRDSALATPDVEAFIPQSTVQSLDIYTLILMLHLSLDTFELPRTKEDSVCTDMFSPAVVIDGAVSANAEASVSTNGIASVGSGSALRRTSGAATESKATALLANLDNRLQRKAAGSSRKSLPGVGKGDERRWAEHVRKMAKEQARAKRVSMKTVPVPVALTASSQLSLMSTRIILNTMWMMLEECPTALDNVDASDVFVLRDCNIEESLLAGISNLRIVPFVRMSLCVLLHGLFCNQTEEMVVDLFLSTVSVIRKFGAKMFLLAVEDSLQYWLRIAIFYCGFSNPAIQGGACDFLLCMLRACFHYFGSFTLISNTLLAVLGDSLDEILDYNRQSIKTYADEDRQLKHVSDAIDSMRSAAKAKLQSVDQRGLPVRSPFCLSLLTFLSSLDVLLVAHSDLRRYVTHPVGYDFYGANLLDGPWDARTTVLVQALRMRRRAVTSDPGEQNSAAKAGFQIEEVMMRFVAASEVYDAFRLPRFRMFWLENLARLHELCGNRAEGAEIRWRIFSLANELQDSWMKLWSPRPPLLWLRRGNTLNAADSSAIANNVDPTRKTASDNDRNFYKVLIRALDAKCMHPWLEHSQYTTHMITSLSVAAERFCSTNLVHLAERASGHLVTLYRLGRKTDLMISEYSRMANALKATNDKGINITIAMGTFYRVYYDGLGVPPFLRKKEFIFRNANHLHVSEFHALVMSHLKAVVGEGIEVKMIRDVSAQADYSDPKTACLVMNSVKLVMNKGHVSTVNKASARINKSFQNSPVETLNQVNVFTFSVPFTQDPNRSQAKKIEDQWLRKTVLYTHEFFPYILTRQQVINREITLLCPIEVASVDIEDCIEGMEMELTVESKDTNNLMRIVQGSVLPQVNAGAAEVAKVFLSPSRVHSEEMQLQLRVEAAKETVGETDRRNAIVEATAELEKTRNRIMRLKVTLLNFLLCSKQLLLKTRRVLLPDISALEQPSPLLNEAPNPYFSIPPFAGIGGGIGAGTSSMPSTTQPPPPTSVSSNPNLSALANPSPTPPPPPASTLRSGLGLFGGGGNRRSSVGESPLTTANINTLNNATQPAATNTNAAAAASPYSQQELGYIKWQNEMERGYEILVQAIYPYIAELKEAEVFNPTRY